VLFPIPTGARGSSSTLLDRHTQVRLGCIDIGSNTTRLLVADCSGLGLTWVHEERAFTRIGHELQQTGRIGSAKIAEVVVVVAGQLGRAHAHGATTVRAVATAAIRSAENGTDLAAAIEAATGLTVEILSAEEEARLAFVGVAGTLERRLDGELGVVDVGGGSSELVVGDLGTGVRWWVSVPLGSGALSYSILRSDPPTASELAAADREIHAALEDLHPPQPHAAVAVGGSATSLARLAGPHLDAAGLGQALDVLTSAPAWEIANRFVIDVQRVRLLPAGLLILKGVTELFGVQLNVGRGGIREGVLLETRR
jgi:exopolyphosphatase / guanosine-5'-triphosphate,3'-diphosphate pyrophosphatase